MTTDDPDERPCWWLPSLGFFLFLAVNLAVFDNSSRLFSDPGVGRHLRMAAVIAETGQIPRTDPLSFTHAGEPFTDYEWAFEATLAGLYHLGGLGLIAAFCASLSAATLLVLFRTLLRDGLPLHVIFILCVFAYATLHLHYLARPLLFSYLFFALVIEVWRGRPSPLRRDFILLPLVFAAWANLHAGWAAALVFFLLSWMGRLFDLGWRRARIDRPLRLWAYLILLCALATLLNPFGLQLHRQIFLFATSYKSFVLWDEFAVPDFAGPSMTALTLLFALAVLCLARVLPQAPRWTWAIMLPFFFFFYSGLKAQRHVLLFIEVAAVPLARDLAVVLAWRGGGFIRERLVLFQQRQRLAQGDSWLALVAAPIIAAVFLAQPVSRAIVVGPDVTSKLVTFLKEHPDRFTRPLTTTWNAGPLLWRMGPRFRVAFDDRGDFYGDKEVFAYTDLHSGKPGWRETLTRSGATSAILETRLALIDLLPTVPGWRRVYSDGKSVVFWKD